MEFNAAKLRRINSKAIVLAVPVPPGHPAHGVIDALRVESMRTGVEHFMTDALSAVPFGRVPEGEYRILRQQATLATNIEFGSPERAVADSGPIDFTGVKVAYKGATKRVLVAGARDEERYARLVVRPEADLLDDVTCEIVGNDLADQRVVPVEYTHLVELGATGFPIV